MNSYSNYESRLWKLLEQEKLADLSQFHQAGFRDEVPLYSRESDLDFLPNNSGITNEILLTFALKFLKAVVAYEEHRAGFFAAITVWRLSGPVVPNLFIWSGPVRELEDKLTLNVVATPFGKRVKRIVSKLRTQDDFELLEDTSTIPNMPRVFFGLARSPYAGFVTLDKLRKPLSSAKS